MNAPRTLFGAVLVSAATLLVVGCSGESDQPELGLVKGTATMDGKPLAKVQIVFAPETGRASTGITDANGSYELTYIRNVKGATLGKHKVRISTRVNESDDIDPTRPNTNDPIPDEYNTKTSLAANVLSGENKFDFALKSK